MSCGGVDRTCLLRVGRQSQELPGTSRGATRSFWSMLGAAALAWLALRRRLGRPGVSLGRMGAASSFDYLPE